MFAKLLEEMLDDESCGCGNCDDTPLTSDRAEELLNMGMNPNQLAVGDGVVRSELGKSAVRFPAEDSQQMARIIAVYDTYRFDSNGQAYNALVDIVINHSTVKTFPADLRYYTKA